MSKSKGFESFSIKHANSAPNPSLSHTSSMDSSTSPTLSRSSTFAKTIPFPDKVIHVVRSPMDGIKLKDVQWVIQGSEEHLRYLRESAKTLGSKREEMRQKYLEVVDEVELLKEDLDAVSRDLDHLSNGKGAEIHATIDRFGKTANLKLHDAPLTEGDEPEQPPKYTGLKFFRKPTVRQYFFNGVLYRSIEMEETRPLELFIDLFYVGIIAINASTVASNPNPFQLHIFALTFIPSWRIWTDLRDLISTYDTDDVVQRMGILFILTCLLGFTINMSDALSSTLAMIISFYVAARIFLAALTFWFAYILPHMRPILVAGAVVNLMGASLWIGSIFIEIPNRYGILWVAIFIDWFGYLGIVVLIRLSPIVSKKLSKALKRKFAYYPAVNIEHHVDRMNAFITLVFGHIILSVLYESSAHFGLNAYFGKATLSMCIAYALNWMYFDVDNANLESHAIRRHIVSSMVYGLAHLPFIMGITLVGASLEALVIASDCSDTDPAWLTDEYAIKSEFNINPGLRWFFCGGLAVAILCMGIISLSHVHADSGLFNLRKRYRLGIRVAVCIILFCLPLATNLNSLQLIGTVTALVWFLLAIETWGNASKCHVWIEGSKKTEYTCRNNYRCVQGEERLFDDSESEKRNSEDGDINLSV